MAPRISKDETENPVGLKLDGVSFREGYDGTPYVSIRFELTPFGSGGEKRDIYIKVDNASPRDSQDAIVELAWGELEQRFETWREIASQRGK